jgi:hypothetical protein
VIRIPRPAGSRPEILSDADGKVTKEIAAARAHLKAAGRKKGASAKRRTDEEASGFKFQLYRKQPVKDALETIFHGKCAYCENRYRAAHPVDVEHWRPKAGVNIPDPPAGEVREPHPGYYWLAAVWENLLPSCIKCNRASTEEQRPTGERVPSGKGSHFPLGSEEKRAYDPKGIDREDPLLLDPSIDHPEQHLEFVEDCVLRARKDPGTNTPSSRGAASISVFGLNRSDLVMERQELMKQITKEQYEMQKLLMLYDSRSSGDESAIIAELLESKIRNLIGMTGDAQKFAFLARDKVLPFLHSISERIPDAPTRELIERATQMAAGNQMNPDA